MGLDPGQRRIGVALSDEDGRFAQPLSTLSANAKTLMDELRELVATWGVSRIVVGLPLTLRGEEGMMAERARRFAGRVAQATGLSVELFDERLSSVSAERVLKEAGLSEKRRRPVVDRVAASFMLQTYLDRQHHAAQAVAGVSDDRAAWAADRLAPVPEGARVPKGKRRGGRRRG